MSGWEDGVEVAIMRLPNGEGVELPTMASLAAAGTDLHAAVTEPVTLAPGARALIRTGFAIALPEGYEAQIRPRSGLALKHGVTVLNSPGTIDADYRGEVGVILINHGNVPFVVQRDDRVAQMMIAPVSRVRWQECDRLPDTARGEGGFGSTGTGRQSKG